MVEYFGEQFSGFAFTANGWVQSYGSRSVKPPIIYRDVSRPKAMTVFWSSMAQEMTKRPMNGMFTGRVTILNWSVRNDQSRYNSSAKTEKHCSNHPTKKAAKYETLVCLFAGLKLATRLLWALAIKDEVEDLEKAGITVIQIDEAALREGLPLRKPKPLAKTY